MILVDTLVWIDQLCSGDKALVRAQDNNEVLTHSFVLGELACGNLGKQRADILRLLRGRAPQSPRMTRCFASSKALR